jgi:predicted transposase YdaD
MNSEKRINYQIYDKTLKALFDDIFKRGILLKAISNEAKKVSDIDTVFKNPSELRIDYAKKIVNKDGNTYILHIEFQSDIDDKFANRMLAYYQVLNEKYNEEIEQILIYVGSPKAKPIINFIEHKNLSFKFNVLDFSQISYENLIKSNSPSEVILALLCNFHGDNPNDIVQKIETRLQEISSNKTEHKKYLKYLLNLVNLRKFDESIVKKIKAMPITADIREGTVYQYIKHQFENEFLDKKRKIEDKVKNNTLKKIALNMYEAGDSIEFISSRIGIPVEDLKKFLKMK